MICPKLLCVAVCGSFMVLMGCDSNKLDKGPSELLNEKLITNINNNCDFAGRDCVLSLRELVDGLSKVYFIERMGASLDKCTTVHINADLKRSYTPLCQYVLFEKHGEITAYIRGFCLSDIKVDGDEIGFDIKNAGFVSKMDGDKKVVVSRSDKTTNRQGPYIYSLKPDIHFLHKLTPTEDKCVGSDM